ncbi:hypothetical protein AB6802_15625 [Mesorhizobium sp. RCC_202]|jgi:pyrroline-5-carboxylate reductase|uniref:DUF768 domain-containing protein n=1 Tax=Mesorhizobium sp. RCC_202 TaxID=3239222 RepID=UPI003523F576
MDIGFPMSARGIDFLHKWMEDNLPHHSASDPAFAAKLAQQATMDAIRAGIQPEEISEEVGSLLTTMREVLEKRDSGLAD